MLAILSPYSKGDGWNGNRLGFGQGRPCPGRATVPFVANDPMPWQLTVGELRAALEDVPDQVVVGLSVPPGTLGHPELMTVHMVRPREYSGGRAFTLVVGLPPGPDFQALAMAACGLLEPLADGVLSRPAMAVRLHERIHGQGKGWQRYLDGTSTLSELRDVLLGDALDAVAHQCPSWEDLDPATRSSLVQEFDALMEPDVIKG